MSSPEVDFVLETLGSVVGDQPADHPLKRVDRDDSEVYDGSADLDMMTPIHKRTDSLMRGNYVSASLATESPVPVGTEYDHRLETVVNVRLEGMTSQGGNWGHVDPSGSDGVAFTQLVRDVKAALYAVREWPGVTRPDTTYHTLYLENEDDQSGGWRDFYRRELDARFVGYEELP